MTQTEKLLYTAKTHTTGGREHGVSRSSDGLLDVRLSTLGVAGIGTNPEQLFAAGWSACFEGAMGIAARKRKIRLPEDLAIDAEVDLNLDEGAFFSARASRQRAWDRSRSRTGPAQRSAPDLSVFEGNSRERRRRHQPRLTNLLSMRPDVGQLPFIRSGETICPTKSITIVVISSVSRPERWLPGLAVLRPPALELRQRKPSDDRRHKARHQYLVRTN